MRGKVASPVRLALHSHRESNHLEAYLPRPKREFFVEEHRKDIDEYMIGQIKRNKKSVKNIKHQIQHLRAQMDHLKDQNKKQRSDYDQLSCQVRQLKSVRSEPKFDSTTKRLFNKQKRSSNDFLLKTRRQFLVSRQSSQFSKISSGIVQTVKNKSLSSTKKIQGGLKKSGSCSRHEPISKTLLKMKIEDLKEKAHVVQQVASDIQQKINKKIERKMERSDQGNPIICAHEVDHKADGYEELAKLLKTNQRIPSKIHQDSPTKDHLHIELQNHLKQQPSFNIDQNHETAPNNWEKSMLSTNRDRNNLKSSAATSYYAAEQNYLKPTSSSRLPSQTNLLDSDKYIVTKSVQKLQVSRCINVQVAAEAPQPQHQFEGFLQRSYRASGSGLSFEDRSDCEKQLKELQFQFDQLVRQQLMSNDKSEKEILGKTIRNLLGRIGELREQGQQFH